MALNNYQQSFFALLRAGLWGDHREVQVFKSSRVQESVDWGKVYQLAQEQSVQGIVLQGIEHFRIQDSSFKIPKGLLLQWIGEVRMIEHRNKEMNAFVAELIKRLSKAGIYAILVKGQGIAQCYEQPLWRSSGDVDLLLSEDNYEQAKNLLIPQADSIEQEFVFLKHLGMQMEGWEVELHGTLRPRLSKRIDRVIDEVQEEVFYGGKVRSWMNGQTQVFLPGVDEDALFVFAHILQHYYQEGVGLRQICDWCRLLWTYRDSLNHDFLESRLRKAGLMSEWRAFAAYVVDYLWMPVEAIPLYSSARKWSKKAERINDFVMEVGNFGHKRRASTIGSRGFIARKAVSLWHRTTDSARHFLTFPLNSIRIWWYMVRTGVMVMREE